jgi:hypothetical protein
LGMWTVERPHRRTCVTEWYDVTVSFEADSQEDAEMVVDKLALVICRGHGQGLDHVCKYQFVIGGPKLIPDNPED